MVIDSPLSQVCLFLILISFHFVPCDTEVRSSPHFKRLHITNVDPYPLETGVAKDRTVVITFTSPLDSSSINSETIIITGPTGHVPARIWCRQNQVFVEPLSDLNANGRYEIEILKGLKYGGICAHSPEGIPLVEEYSFSFTTGVHTSEGEPLVEGYSFSFTTGVGSRIKGR